MGNLLSSLSNGLALLYDPMAWLLPWDESEHHWALVVQATLFEVFETFMWNLGRKEHYKGNF